MQLPLNIRLRDDATLATYVGNAARRLLDTKGMVFVWGAPGTGRSHLLQAACHDARDAGESPIYLTGLAQHAAGVLDGLEQLPLVCIDDIHEILPSEAWETALFHLVNAVRDRGGRLIVSANCAPARLDVGLADLRSRLLGAASIETDNLDDSQKLAVLKQKAAVQGFDLGDEVGRFIMSRADRDVRTLMDLFAKLEIETLRRQKKVTIPFVKEVLGL